MIVEALNFLTSLKAAALSPQAVHETRTTKVVRADGATYTYDKDVPPRGHKADTLDDLAALANRFKQEDRTPVVWYNEDGVNLVINDGEHRDDVVGLKLTRSNLFNAIVALDPRRWYDPKSFIRLLRVELAGALDSQTLLDPVRRVKFENGATASFEKTRSRESLGREITSSVKTEVEIPEYVVLRAPIYTTPGVQTEVSIRAAVEVDPAMGQFQIAVLPDEIQKAVNVVMGVLGETLSAELDSEIPSYQGSPS